MYIHWLSMCSSLYDLSQAAAIEIQILYLGVTKVDDYWSRLVEGNFIMFCCLLLITLKEL